MGAQVEDEHGAQRRTSKQVYFSILPDKYEPLIEEGGGEEAAEERRKRMEEKRKKKKLKYKKYKKNVRKALRFSWRCLISGLQSMASAYSTPLAAMATVATETQRAAASRA